MELWVWQFLDTCMYRGISRLVYIIYIPRSSWGLDWAGKESTSLLCIITLLKLLVQKQCDCQAIPS